METDVLVPTHKTYVEPMYFKKQMHRWKDMLFISLFVGFRNNGTGGCGIVLVARNDLFGPEIAENWRLRRDDFNKSSVQNRPLALVVGTQY